MMPVSRCSSLTVDREVPRRPIMLVGSCNCIYKWWVLAILLKHKCLFATSYQSVMLLSTFDKYQYSMIIMKVGSGVPLVVVPVLLDQVRNAYAMKRAGLAVVLEK